MPTPKHLALTAVSPYGSALFMQSRSDDGVVVIASDVLSYSEGRKAAITFSDIAAAQ